MDILLCMAIAIGAWTYLITNDEDRVRAHLVLAWVLMSSATVGWIIWLLIRSAAPT